MLVCRDCCSTRAAIVRHCALLSAECDSCALVLADCVLLVRVVREKVSEGDSEGDSDSEEDSEAAQPETDNQ